MSSSECDFDEDASPKGLSVLNLSLINQELRMIMILHVT